MRKKESRWTINNTTNANNNYGMIEYNIPFIDIKFADCKLPIADN